MNDLLDRARHLAVELGDRHLGTEQLLLAMLEDRGALATTAVADLGPGAVEQVKENLRALLASEGYRSCAGFFDTEGRHRRWPVLVGGKLAMVPHQQRHPRGTGRPGLP